mmetsp:Transcript_53161/g.64046  ORF Transcript_53161/g.64046 Transcript_53161/m.64046 type:complete len:533 (+) Transcript_53161:113-1711(+)|eukprot:CAMPEP_0172499400 /NCGR_PEP_ID=MMETSP1066-20121228/126746_1 /TAXON_ID=671091 /ORGANISM="Coscinodiscus wailesii, Strain CCMP2513" /LENGTH=532 /DNA_ID=CAMNT_0013273129 /DNA_START=113 /DNA_END=1711 /DNA_ORIENTATION=-
MANNLDNNDVPSIIDVSSIPSENDSFVQIMDIDTATTATTNSHHNVSLPSLTPALSLKLLPRYASIGTEAPLSRTQICATITARDIPPEHDNSRAPVDIVVALDVSGSMSGNKLALCKVTLKLLLGELQEKDRFGLVTFSNNASTVIPAQRLTQANKDRALQEIERVHATGSTNMSGGISLAMQEMQSIDTPNEVRCVFLLTDGHANIGIVNASGIIDLTKNCLQQLSSSSNNNNGNSTNNPPVTIHTFGYGRDHDDELLRELSLSSPAGAGTYYFVETDDNVVSAFGDALGGILSVVAQNTILTISVVPQGGSVNLIDIHHKSKIMLDEGKVYKVTMGDFYAQETRDLIFSMTLAEGSSDVDTPVPHVTVSMVYTDTIDKKMVRAPVVVASIDRPFGTSTVSKEDPYVAWQWLRINTTTIMTNAQDIAKRGDISAARSIINDQLKEIRKVVAESNSNNPLASQLISDLNAVLGGLVDYRAFRGGGGMAIRNKIQSHQMQRSSEATRDAKNVYRTDRRMKMAKKCYKSAFGK